MASFWIAIDTIIIFSQIIYLKYNDESLKAIAFSTLVYINYDYDTIANLR